MRSENYDATAPDLGTFEQASVWRAGQTATFEFRVDEALASLELAFDVSDAGAPACEVDDGLLVHCRYLVLGTENGGFGGVAHVSARAADVAGNVSSRPRIGQLVFDFTPPALAGASISPQRARLGDTVQLFLATSEALREPPVIAIDPPLTTKAGTVSSIVLVRDDGTLNYHAAIPVDAGGSGVFEFTTQLVDLPGNSSELLTVGSVTIDAKPPAVFAFTVSPATARDGDIVTITVSLDEPPEGPPVVRLGNRPLSVQPGAAETDFIFTTTIDSGVFSDNVYPVSLEAADAAQNRSATPPHHRR